MKILGVRKRAVKSNGQFLNQNSSVKSTPLWPHKKTKTDNFCMYENKHGTFKTKKVEQEVGKSQQSIKTIG